MMMMMKIDEGGKRQEPKEIREKGVCECDAERETKGKQRVKR